MVWSQMEESGVIKEALCSLYCFDEGSFSIYKSVSCE